MQTIKIQAIKLRKDGKSYNEINKILKIPKSTLSTWLKKFSFSEEIKNKNISASKKIWAQNITKYNKERSQKAILASKQIENEAASEIPSLNKTMLKIVGSALYWAEGYKKSRWELLFCNSDPTMVKLMMQFFREVCKVPEDKFRPQVQIHPNIDRETAENYWANIANLDKKIFRKSLMQISKSSKQKKPRNTLPYGTFRIGVANSKVLSRIKGWIKGLSQY